LVVVAEISSRLLPVTTKACPLSFAILASSSAFVAVAAEITDPEPFIASAA
jgi:hypothetical protein